ncbi:energy transducer TonB, partial [Rhodosalinus sp.]|uniref:energy transducer TonB family protein n=2 Tax=Rhodosalinus sp. TaxID=2047741 RepID=UPI00397DA604
EVAEAAPAAPAEEAQASDAPATAVERSLRPQVRAPQIEERQRQAEAARRAAEREQQAAREAERQRRAESERRAAREAERQRQAAQTPQGNAEQNARAGQASGEAQAEAVSRGAGGPSRETGNAAASNYPGEVMRKLSRVRRPSVSARGAAVVTFRIAPGGALAGVSIARSSGSTRLDRAALAMVQRAAPFPPPPRGAQRSFSIEIAGR